MVELLRYQLFLSIGILFLQLWRTSLTHLDSIKSSWLGSALSSIGSSNSNSSNGGGDTVEIIVKYMPLWAILILGLYALFSVLYRVATFGDCSEATEELSRQIVEAKEKLKVAGFAF
mmetsp:Transcript_7775/g.17548  ORF Transcript_7775/g.17548 Transcript_7775/m.17548 type:complete len:117 (-) Transcript_7775:461-811(-)|eukprot:CAMPEP_0172298198 /NCGR_PEP_ID=MMETSP1058-20130122/963_1 /TAXON_ID=83371 /ORGANISM="Detonula confervacea, Strain CCMP 353" /LENGTH=116 /DNA_ID=CAMNT_0013007457 /DNA_START=72 /DNA_END=422 /DNA_ORIENTATION=+